ncbi:MAG: TRAM domain-containing protein, partial [Cytophagales bacterium]
MRKPRPENVVIEDALVENYAAEGKALAKVDGKVIFIPFAAKGDVVDVRLLRSKKSFAEAELLRVKKKSEDRVEPLCVHFGTCGGCKWQHLKYEIQLEVKRQTVCDALTHIAGLDATVVESIVPSDAVFHYRNKLEFTFTASRWLTVDEIKSDAQFDRKALGFHIPGRFDKVFDVQQCFLQDDISNQIREFVKLKAQQHEISFFDMNQKKGVLRNLILRNSSRAS